MELPLDVVFTVETSVRTALMAVWRLTGLQKPMIPVYEPTYDLRVVLANLKASLGIDEFSFCRAAPLAVRAASRLDLPSHHGPARVARLSGASCGSQRLSCTYGAHTIPCCNI